MLRNLFKREGTKKKENSLDEVARYLYQIFQLFWEKLVVHLQILKLYFSSSDEEWEKMQKKFEREIDKLLDEGPVGMKKKKRKSKKGDETVDNEGEVDSSEEMDEWSTENLMTMMKQMEMEFDSKKKRNRSNFWFNTFIGMTFACMGAYIARIYTTGQWKALKDCEGEEPASFCNSCFGPFSEWLWCVEDM